MMSDRNKSEEVNAAWSAGEGTSAEKCPPTPIKPFPGVPDYVISIGSRDELVNIVQIMLRVLKIYYDTFGNVPIGGVYDIVTSDAVKAFQRANGMGVTGCVDVYTWNRLADEYNTAVFENQ